MKWNKSEVIGFQNSLLDWYQANRKALPWRETKEAYKIWLSEIMSQQTQVETVIPYYKSFLEKYPDISALADADDAELLKLWEGLGYYSRARNLKSGAQQIMAEFNGQFPRELDKIRSIKGIGPYSAASIGSICFKLPEPAIDGNLFRVSSRIFEISDDISKTSSRKIFDEKLRQVISIKEPGDFNQALMDLGATICLPKAPKCAECPVILYCSANANGTQEYYPIKTKKIKQKNQYYQAFAVKSADKYLMSQRRKNGLLADMWTFPMLETEEKAEVELPSNLKDKVIKYTEIGEITHIFSHLKWHVRLFVCQLEEDDQVQANTAMDNQKWLSKKDLMKHALAGPQIKLFKLLQDAFHGH
ncbi:MAG: A/G-specific adenine glycosylase [Streptococcaceae bacterium]|jgi:A/G-specific adenine glycosylase|nr:A/G-specific adenine glycosylase [Streptococcaceae bacterium]